MMFFILKLHKEYYKSGRGEGLKECIVNGGKLPRFPQTTLRFRKSEKV